MGAAEYEDPAGDELDGGGRTEVANVLGVTVTSTVVVCCVAGACSSLPVLVAGGVVGSTVRVRVTSTVVVASSS